MQKGKIGSSGATDHRCNGTKAEYQTAIKHRVSKPVLGANCDPGKYH